MKLKIFLSAAMAVAALSACRNDDEPASIVGTWAMKRKAYVNVKDGAVLHSEENECLQKSTEIFTSEGKLQAHHYTLSSGKCTDDLFRDFTYEYDGSKKYLTIISKTRREIYDVDKLNNSELVISNVTLDYNHDGVNDKYIISFTRIK